MADIWLHSDWHWQHHNIYTFTDRLGQRIRREFANAEDGDAYIAQAWAEDIKPEDHVWCLGDMTMFRGKHKATEFIHLMRSLPGHKRLILGNHDHYDMGVYVEAGFKKIRGSNMLDGLLLTHYPIHPGSLGFKTKANVHGHIHRNPSPPGLYINACVEVRDYRPVPFEDIKVEANQLKELYGNSQ